MRAGIQAYNAVHNIKDSPTSGYHATVTQAWLRLVGKENQKWDAFVSE